MASIIKRGNSYRATVSLYHKGESTRKTKTFATKKAAKKWTYQLESQKLGGGDLIKREQTFADFFENWFQTVKRDELREATILVYEHALRTIRNLYGQKKLKDLTATFVQSGINKYSEGRAKSSVNQFVIKVRSCLRYAHQSGVIPVDFSGLLKAHGAKSFHKNRSLTVTEFATLRHYLIDHLDDELCLMILLVLETGMRRGELFGLKPEDLYRRDNKYVVKIRRARKSWTSKLELKTEQSQRDITVNRIVYDTVKKVPTQASGYIFAMSNDKIGRKLKTVLKQLNIAPTTVHGLRDTHASFLFSQGLDLAFISNRLGHSSLQTTQNYYIQLLPERQKQESSKALHLLDQL